MSIYTNLYIDQGSDYEESFKLKDDVGDPLDLADHDFHGQIRRTSESDTAYDFTIVKSTTIDGMITLELDKDVSETMRRGRYMYDVFATNTNTDTRFKVLEGIVEITPQITRTV